MTDKNNKFTETPKIPAPHKPMNTWKHMVAHVCILFLVIALVLVYFTSTGSPQAGLLEVGVSAFIFVGLFHLVMKFFPLVSKIITSVIVIGFGIALILVNYHYLKVVKRNAPMKQLLVGDLIVHKILKTFKKEPFALATKQEVPETISEPNYEKPLSTISLTQLKIPVAEPISVGPNLGLLHVTSPAPMIKTGVAVIAENYKIEPYIRTMAEEISRLTFITKEREPITQYMSERKDITISSLSGVIQETPIMALKDRKVQPPISEIPVLIHMIKSCKPLKEGRVPIN